MGRKRTVRTYSDTSAEGERSPIKGNRYFVEVELVSIKLEEETDMIGRTSELYLRAGGKGLFELDKRTPDQGTINLELNEVFVPQDRLTLYSAFIEKDGGGSVEIPIKVFDDDFGKDDTLIDTSISVSMGQSTDYQVFMENGVKIKIGASANQTRY